MPFSIQYKNQSKTPKINLSQLTIQEPIFSVSNTEFEGGDDGHGYGDCIFLVKLPKYCVFHKEPAVGMTLREPSRTSCEGRKMLHGRPRSTVKAPLSALHFP
jgi:hypothetical protein